MSAKQKSSKPKKKKLSVQQRKKLKKMRKWKRQMRKSQKKSKRQMEISAQSQKKSKKKQRRSSSKLSIDPMIDKKATPPKLQTADERHIILDNLFLRYDLGLIKKCSSFEPFFESINIYNKEWRFKCLELAQHTILENFELKEMTNELKDENFHLRNEVYELADKAIRQSAKIKLLTKSYLSDIDLLQSNVHLFQEILSMDPEYNDNNKLISKSNGYGIPYDERFITHTVMCYDVDTKQMNKKHNENDTKDRNSMRKSAGLMQKLVLENAELRAEIIQRRDSNFWLRNAIYSQQDQVNRFEFTINKLDQGLRVEMYEIEKIIARDNIEAPVQDQLAKWNVKEDDWDKYENIAIDTTNGYIREYMQQNMEISVPIDINTMIAGYCIHIPSYLFST